MVAIFSEKTLQQFVLAQVRRRRRNIADARREHVGELRIDERVAEEVLAEGPLQDRVGRRDVGPLPAGARAAVDALVRVVAAHDAGREQRLVEGDIDEIQVLNRNARLRRARCAGKRIEEAAAGVGIVADSDLLLSRNEDTPPNRGRGKRIFVRDVPNQSVAAVSGIGLDVDALDAVRPSQTVEGDVFNCVQVERRRDRADAGAESEMNRRILDENVVSRTFSAGEAPGFRAVRIIEVFNVAVSDDDSVSANVDAVGVEGERWEVDACVEHLAVLLLKLVLIEDGDLDLDTLNERAECRSQVNVVSRPVE